MILLFPVWHINFYYHEWGSYLSFMYTGSMLTAVFRYPIEQHRIPETIFCMN